RRCERQAMLQQSRPLLQAPRLPTTWSRLSDEPCAFRAVQAALAALALGFGIPAWAQEDTGEEAAQESEAPLAGRDIGFEADAVSYDAANEVVTASGDVVLR